MNLVERIDKLRALLQEVGGEVVGRKKFHKIIYLMQKKEEDFSQDFKYHHFGVWSPTLSEDVSLACHHNIVSESESDTGFTIKLTDPTSLNTEQGTIINTDFLHILNSLEPRELEVLSTIVYLFDNGYRNGKLRTKLIELKPKLKRHFDKGFQLAQKYYSIK